MGWVLDAGYWILDALGAGGLRKHKGVLLDFGVLKNEVVDSNLVEWRFWVRDAGWPPPSFWLDLPGLTWTGRDMWIGGLMDWWIKGVANCWMLDALEHGSA